MEKESLIPKDKILQFKNLLLEKLEIYIENDSLLNHNNLAHILYFWREKDADNLKIKKWCAKIIKKDDGMMEFIKKFIFKSSSYSQGNITITSYIDPNWISPFVDVKIIEKRIVDMKEHGNIPQEYEEAATLFLQGVKLRREGKSPEDIL